MKATNESANRARSFRVRPVLVGCAIVLVVLILPNALTGRHLVQQLFLLGPIVSIASGWFFLLKDRSPNQTWRNVIALVTSLYLMISIPVFFIESSQMRWLGGHQMLSMYVWPWVQWGYALVIGGVAGTFFGRGRARVAFATGAILLLILRLGMGIWVY